MKEISSPKMVLISMMGALLVGCAGHPGWAEYRKAMKCHLEEKNQECNKHYEKAIKHDKDLPGVYASYGSHLYKNGNTQDAEQHFKTEIQKHPEVEQALRIVMNKAQGPVGPDNESAGEESNDEELLGDSPELDVDQEGKTEEIERETQ